METDATCTVQYSFFAFPYQKKTSPVPTERRVYMVYIPRPANLSNTSHSCGICLYVAHLKRLRTYNEKRRKISALAYFLT